jgi:hypothetical protein
MMRNLLMLATAIAFGASAAAAASAAVPTTNPFPSAKITGVFVGADTVNSDGVQATQFAPGATVTFRAYARDLKTKKALTGSDTKAFYVAIPGQPNVNFSYDTRAKDATVRAPWTAKWLVPANMNAGTVAFKVLVKTKTDARGQFVQLPVSASMLTISSTPTAVYTPAPTAPATAAPSTDVSLYVDSVNGTRPSGAAPRPVGCTQTNVYKRGEQFVVRAWGAILSTGDILSNDNVDTAIAQIPGQKAVTLNYGAHGATGSQVWYYTGAWNIPADYPLGQANVHVVFKTDDGKIGVYDYPITINP